MNLVPTELNRRVSEAVHRTLAAERFTTAGRAGFWRLVGVGLVCFGLGGALGLVCYGYGEVRLSSENIGKFSAAFSKALSTAKLSGKAEGTVRFQPDLVPLAKGQTISVDPNSRLNLEPGATVHADGEIKVQVPPPAPAPLSLQPKSAAPLISDFTVFKHVQFGKGTVITGWKFLTSKQVSPSSQYCYYIEDTDDTSLSGLPGLSVVLDLGRDERLDVPKTLPKDFDANAAFARCVWFRS